MRYDTISVALCTYNGAKYLPQQLGSLKKQHTLPTELIVSDDGSTDLTVEMVEEFKREAPFALRLSINSERLGVVKNFSRAVSLCRGRYIALCDQDDIWLSPRLSTTLEKMKTAEKQYGADRPIMVHTDLSVINARGKHLAPSYYAMRRLKPVENGSLKTLVMQNVVTGCSVLINRPLADLALPFPPTVVMHDWWLALVAAAAGKLIYDPYATVLYRQHDDNVMGAIKYFSLFSINKIFNIESLEKDLARRVDQALTLKKILNKNLDLKAADELDELASLASHVGFRASHTALRSGFRQTDPLRSLVFLTLLFRGRYRQYLSPQSRNK